MRPNGQIQRPLSAARPALRPLNTGLLEALRLIPCGVFILTAAHDHSRGAALVRWVQACSINPPMVLVAMPLGQAVEPLVRDSRSFALCQVGAGDRFLPRKLSHRVVPGEDPLVSILTTKAPSGSPIIDRALSYLDCELVRHLDIEGDCGLFIGLVRGGSVLHTEEPAVRYGSNGHSHGHNGADRLEQPTRNGRSARSRI
jgi:flavin reductase (DIM6/NTAB) family NADH-FMN oxidoreductase RutF